MNLTNNSLFSVWCRLPVYLLTALLISRTECHAETQNTYDNRSQLIRVDCVNGTVTDFVYDPAGNRLLETVTAPGGANNRPPDVPFGQNIANGAGNVATLPTVSWRVSDPDAEDSVVSDLYLGTDNPPPLLTGGFATNYTPVLRLVPNTQYYWYVIARDNHNASSTGTVWSFTTTNLPPVCAFSADGATNGEPGLSVTFTDQSTSEDDAVVAWAWDLNGDSTVDCTNRYATFVYTVEGTYDVRLTVTDAHGASNSFARLAYVSIVAWDTDGDGRPNENDNCPFIYNPYQEDGDRDSIGDVCDSDRDGDGVPNAIDNCPDCHNPGQMDRDGDGFGDDCSAIFTAATSAELQAALDMVNTMPTPVVIHLQTGVYRVSDNGNRAFHANWASKHGVALIGGYKDVYYDPDAMTTNPALTVLDGVGVAGAYGGVLQLVHTNWLNDMGMIVEGTIGNVPILLKNLTVCNGRATTAGGGVYVDNALGSTRLEMVAVSNCAASQAGGVYVGGERTDVKLDRVRVVNNTAAYNAGAWVDVVAGTFTANNSLFAANMVSNYGGGLSLSFGGSGTITHCTLAGNRSSASWGFGLGLLANLNTNTASLAIRNSIVAENATSSASAADLFFNSSGVLPVSLRNSNLSTNVPGGRFASVTACVFAAPHLLEVMNGVCRLGPLSPCINAADPAYALSVDLDGISRPRRGLYQTQAAPDMGALEYDYTGDSDGDGVADTEEATLGSNPERGDSDGDGQGDYAEWIAGTSLTNPASLFLITSINVYGSNAVLRWPSAQSRVYDVYRQTNLTSAAQMITNGVPAHPPENVHTDRVNRATDSLFYWLRVRKP